MRTLKYFTSFLLSLLLASAAQAYVVARNETGQSVFMVVFGTTERNTSIRQLAPIRIERNSVQPLHLLKVLGDVMNQNGSDPYTKLGLSVRDLHNQEATCFEVQPVDDLRRTLETLTHPITVTVHQGKLFCNTGG